MPSCPSCASVLAGSPRFCPDCAAPLEETPTGTAPRRSPSPPPTPGGSRRGTGSTGSARTTTARSDGRFTAGDLLSERYRIVGLLGRGGMGEVYRADDLKLGQPVALKFLPEAVARDPERLDRFYNEVRVARQVSHANVCRVYDIGEMDGEHFLSMEFVDGEDLASLLRRIGRLPGDKAVEIARQLCAGLAAAHDKGLLHRDLKPENVMIDGRGRVRVTDFGLAGVAETIAEADVRSGTPAYMSPEQLAGREVSLRSDIYALGLVLFELFTGKRAFEGKSFAELRRKHEQQAPPSPSQIVGDVDPAVERVILRCLEKDPARRPASALAVAAALPGGDPLAAALAAGETPSPELVAAAGEEGGLRPAQVWGLLAAIVLGSILCMSIWARRGFLRFTPVEKPPVVLADAAREMMARLGHPEAVADSAYGFARDASFLRYMEERDKSLARWETLRLARPPLLLFWYRQSPRTLVSTSPRGRVSGSNPPADASGMSGVLLDAKGRLVSFYSVPPQLEEPVETSAPPDWSRLFAEARLDMASFTPVAPRWNPPFTSDARAAWEGSFAERPDIKIRLEAAGHRGQLVWFDTVLPWRQPERMQPYELRRGDLIANTIASLLIVCAVVASALLARHNVRSGRSDRRGASRLTAFAFGAQLLAWALTASHVADFNAERGLATRGMGLALLSAASLGLLYLALEPYVRRLWPDALISWTRLLSGRIEDPLVGSHVLLGVGYGVAMALLIALVDVALRWGQAAPSPVFLNMDALLGVPDTALVLLNRAFDSTAGSLATALLFVGMLYLLRRQWLTALAVTALVSLPDAFQTPLPPYVSIPITMLLFSLFMVALLRHGLLCLIVTLFTVGALINLPLTTELARWYAQPTLVVVAALAALCAYATRAALSPGRTVLRTP